MLLHQLEKMPCVGAVASADDDNGIRLRSQLYSRLLSLRCRQTDGALHTVFSRALLLQCLQYIIKFLQLKSRLDDYSITLLARYIRDIFYTFYTDSVFSCPF